MCVCACLWGLCGRETERQRERCVETGGKRELSVCVVRALRDRMHNELCILHFVGIIVDMISPVTVLCCAVIGIFKAMRPGQREVCVPFACFFLFPFSQAT